MNHLQEPPEPSDDLLGDTISRIRAAHEPGPETEDLARFVLENFVSRQQRGIPQSPATLEWLSEAFIKFMNREDPLAAFGFPRRPRHRPANDERASDIAWWVYQVECRGYTRAEAIKEAADTFDTDVSNVRKLVNRAHIKATTIPERGVKMIAEAFSMTESEVREHIRKIQPLLDTLDQGDPSESHYAEVYEKSGRPLPPRKNKKIGTGKK